MSLEVEQGALHRAKTAIQSIGLGFDLTNDLRLEYCKQPQRRVVVFPDEDKLRDISIPGVGSIPDVPKPINCEKGESFRFSSDVLSFEQMSDQFNQELSLFGKIPSGHFNAAFDFREGWQRDAAGTKALAFDGVFITLYSITLERSQLVLADHIKEAVPSSWNPQALARFIQTYGTHVIIGVKMGGKDVIYVKQQHLSPLKPADVQRKLKDMAHRLLIDGKEKCGTNTGKLNEKDPQHNHMEALPPATYSRLEVQDSIFECKRRGGSMNKNLSHSEWRQTVRREPDVIFMTLIPITSLLSGIPGSGFLSHAINLYLSYKPPIKELHQFLEFQLPIKWAPAYEDLPFGTHKKQQTVPSLKLSFMGPKLYINTTPVDVGKKPVTGLRLYLEGKRSNRLAIHLRHLQSQPTVFQIADETNSNSSDLPDDCRYYEKFQWNSLSHICMAPVESDDDLSIVTGAYFEVGGSGLKKVLFLRLHFSKVVGAIAVRRPVWDSATSLLKSGTTTLISTSFSSKKQTPPPSINSSVYPGGPPVPTRLPKLHRLVDTTEVARGPEDPPGYWVVSGARLIMEKGKIYLQVKYSLLTTLLPNEEISSEV